MVGRDYVVVIGRDEHPITVDPCVGGYAVTVGGASRQVLTDWTPGDLLLRGQVDSRPVCVQIGRDGLRYRLTRHGGEISALVVTPRAAELARFMLEKQPPDLSRFLLSPMPGLLMTLVVEEGQQVKAGEELAVVEAMKMENVLRAERDGTVAKVHARPGESLTVDQAILEFE